MVRPISEIDVLARVLNATSMRHQAIAQNVANVNTPNYRPISVAFEDDLERALKTGKGVKGVKPHMVDAGGTPRDDGNAVDIDKEMGQLTKNGLLAAAATQILAMRLASLRSAITGR